MPELGPMAGGTDPTLLVDPAGETSCWCCCWTPAAAAEADVPRGPRLAARAAAAAVAGCDGGSSWLSPLLPLPELSIRKARNEWPPASPCITIQ